jgi:hypothetical protein
LRRLIVVAVLLPLLAMAETPVYRSFDKEGRVIYSPRPPADAVKSEEVAIPPPPPESEVQRAEEETRKRKAQLERLDQERRLRAAEEQERQRRELESMPVQQPQNWWPIPAIVTHPLPEVPPTPDAPPASPAPQPVR